MVTLRRVLVELIMTEQRYRAVLEVEAGVTLAVEAADTTFRIYLGDQLVAEAARTTTKPIARHKVRKPEPPRRTISARRVPA